MSEKLITGLLYSGGVDSYIINKLENPDVLIYIESGSKYNKEELNLLNNQVDIKNKLVIDYINLSGMDATNPNIYGRNLLFILLGLKYCDDIMLGALHDDIIHDQDIKFLHYANSLFDHFNIDPYTKANKHLLMPYKKYHKWELVDLYLKWGGSVSDIIHNTFSCHTPTEGKECGICRACLHKKASYNHIQTSLTNNEYIEMKLKGYAK
jgi:7-cyano-7-deazaguanine synthase in queuosine biosynthesis